MMSACPLISSENTALLAKKNINAAIVRPQSPCIAFGAADGEVIWSIAQVDLVSGHQVKWKGWNLCGLAAILWRSGRFATPVLLRSILIVAAAGVGSGALSWASATRAGACCRISGTDVGTTAVCTRVSMSTRGGPALTEAIRMTGLATSRWVIVSVSGK
jgi:hypothetical protein